MNAGPAVENPLELGAAEKHALYHKVILRTVPLFFLGFVLSYLDRVNISLAKLQMQADFGLSEHAFAIGASIFFWGYMLSRFPAICCCSAWGRGHGLRASW